MNERVRDILNRIKEFWNKYNKKQKTIMISSVVLVILVVALVVWATSRPKWEELKTCTSYSEVSEVTALLTENQIAYQVKDDALTVTVEKKNLVNSKIILGSNNIQADGYSLSDALNGGFSTTETDKARKYKAYLESKLSSDLSQIDGIKKAYVSIKEAESSSVILSKDEDTSVGVVLVLKNELSEEVGENLAQFIKTAVGNKSTEKITIISSSGASIYSGENNASNLGGSLVSQRKYQAQIESTIKNSIKNALLKIPTYDDAQVSLNLDINYDEVTEISKKYEAQEGREEGLYSQSLEQKNTGTTGAGGIPGTDSNDSDTTYLIQNQDGTTTEAYVKQYWYLPNEFVTTTNKKPGDIILSDSSIAVILHDNVVYSYDEVKASGQLKDMTWNEFKTQHGQYEELPLDDKIKEMVSKGTGISAENISILAYRVPYFIEPAEKASNTSRWITIAVAVAILLLLAFVVFRSARPITVKETEPELSVEEMLAATKEKQGQSVDEIDLQEKSEVRIAIEKFVDENPEAVALLLRNWLDDGWE